MDVRAFGSWTSAPKCLLFLPGFRGRDQSFLPPDVRRDIRVDVRRISGPKTYSLLGRHREGRREGVELLKDLHSLLKKPPPPLEKPPPF